jgi:hypothetical protein
MAARSDIAFGVQNLESGIWESKAKAKAIWMMKSIWNLESGI